MLLLVAMALWPQTAAKVPSPRSRFSGREQRKRPTEEEADSAQPVSRVVDARMSAAGLPAALEIHEDDNRTDMVDDGNSTFFQRLEAAQRRLRSSSKRVLQLSALWLRRQNPGLLLILAATMVTRNAHEVGRVTKDRDLRTMRAQVQLGNDYHIAIVTTAALPWMTGEGD